MRPQHREDDHDRNCKADGADRRRVVDALAAAAQVDIQHVPQALCQACVALLPVTGASLSVSADRAVRVTWCASDRTAARLADAQYTLGDGPCQRALDLAAPVLAADLTRGEDARRWPVFAQQAERLGVRAVFSLPLGTGPRPIGTLDLYRDTVGPLSERDLRIALLLRDAATFAVLNLCCGMEDSGQLDVEEVTSWIEAVEADYTEVHQAVGMVMIQLDVDPQQALDRLRARDFLEGRTVSEVAGDVIARRLRFQPETEGLRARDRDRRQDSQRDDTEEGR